MKTFLLFLDAVVAILHAVLVRGGVVAQPEGGPMTPRTCGEPCWSATRGGPR